MARPATTGGKSPRISASAYPVPAATLGDTFQELGLSASVYDVWCSEDCILASSIPVSVVLSVSQNWVIFIKPYANKFVQKAV